MELAGRFLTRGAVDIDRQEVDDDAGAAFLNPATCFFRGKAAEGRNATRSEDWEIAIRLEIAPLRAKKRGLSVLSRLGVGGGRGGVAGAVRVDPRVNQSARGIEWGVSLDGNGTRAARAPSEDTQTVVTRTTLPQVDSLQKVRPWTQLLWVVWVRQVAKDKRCQTAILV